MADNNEIDEDKAESYMIAGLMTLALQKLVINLKNLEKKYIKVN